MPTQTSQAPEATAARTRLASCLGLGWPSSTVSPGLGATSNSTETLSGPNLLLKTFRCCLANTVVGARTCVFVCQSSPLASTASSRVRHRRDIGAPRTPSPRGRRDANGDAAPDRDLPPAAHRQQRGPNGHLRLAEADIPEDQAVHWG